MLKVNASVLREKYKLNFMKASIITVGHWPISIRLFVCLIVCCCTSVHTQAVASGETRGEHAVITQQVTITGRVVDQQGTPLQGINVALQGSSTATVTNEEGTFSIQVPNDNAVLVFSYLGYETQEVNVGTQRNLNVTLLESTDELEEVVDIGYGTVKKRDLTGAVSVIDVKEMAKTGASTIAQSIQGLAS